MDLEKIRRDFPILQERISGKPIIYMDSACMSLRPVQVVEAMNEYYHNFPACAGRSIHKLGSKVTEKYGEARETVAKFINARKAGEVVFTRNTTEGINLVAHSLGLKKGDVVLTTDIEHNSNLLPWQMLAETGVQHKIVFSKKDMTFDLEAFEKMMNKDVKLVSIVHSSNLDGYTTPAKEIIRIAHDFGSLVMLDAAQSVPHKPVDVKNLDVDFLVFSGHKMLGPSGTGVLYGKYNLLEKLKPFMVGGDTVESSTYESHVFLKPPERFEAGLQNYPGAIGLAEAARYLERVGKDNVAKHETELNKFITKELSGLAGISIIGPASPELRGGIISFNIEGIGFHDIATMLDDMANVMIRSGQHCVHSWFNANKVKGSARVSLYLYNTMGEAKVFIDTLKEILKLR